LTTLVSDHKKELESFSIQLARKWKNYFNIDGLIPGIQPTEEQKHVVQSGESQLIIRGSAGSGKSLMLAYRLIKTMEQSEQPQRILYVTFNQVLTDDTRKRLNLSETYRSLKEKHHVNITTYHDLVRNILMNECGYQHINRIIMTKNEFEKHESLIAARIKVIMDTVKESDEYRHLEKLYQTHTPKFLQEEFFWMKANGFTTKEKYLTCERTGRGNSPSVRMKQRPTIFFLYEKYNEFMRTNFEVPQLDMEDYALHLLNELNMNKNALFKYDHIFVDEFQDLQPMQIISLVALSNNTITLVGDEKQKIYKRSPFSYKDLNLKVNTRTNLRLSKNFRSTKQIMNLANAIQFNDVENVKETDQDFFRKGERPKIRHFSTTKRMALAIIKQIKEIHKNSPDKTIAIIHRYSQNKMSNNSLKNVLDREFDIIGIEKYGKRFNYKSKKKPIFFTTPFEIKGLEFDYVFVIHFDQQHYPSQERIAELNEKYGGENWEDPNYEKDYDVIYNDEKKLLYVACSRARDELFLYYAAQNQLNVSQFIRDFNIYDYEANFNKSMYKE
jgi:DNA helicase II / ATP-dependent DNA helicase PcrA